MPKYSDNRRSSGSSSWSSRLRSCSSVCRSLSKGTRYLLLGPKLLLLGLQLMSWVVGCRLWKQLAKVLQAIQATKD